MSSSNLLRDQIERSAQRLAQLKAREIVSAQRDAARTKEADRRTRASQRDAIGTLLVDAGFGALSLEEVLGAMLSYRESVISPDMRERYKQKGGDWLASNARSRGRAHTH